MKKATNEKSNEFTLNIGPPCVALQRVRVESGYEEISPLLTEKEVCALLNVSKRNLYCWRMAGYVPYIKIGKAIRYRLSDVDEMIRNRFIQH